MSADVSVVGSINLDHTIVTSAFPGPGETILGESVATSVGGKGANQAVAAALAGAHVSIVGSVGSDPDGDRALAALSAAGVSVDRVRRCDDVPTGTAWITVADGENKIIVVPGANEDVTIDGADTEASVTLCQLEIPMDVVASAAGRAGLFILNAAPATEITPALLRQCDVLVVNEHELATITSELIGSVNSIVTASRSLLDAGVRAVITTVGAQGAVLCQPGGASLTAAPRVPVVDTTGAGDAFCGVLAARLAAGDVLSVAVKWGVAAGSHAVQAPSAQSSYPDGAQLKAAVEAIAPAKELTS